MANRLSLWREGIRAFRKHERAWLPPAAIFFAVFLVICFFAIEKLAPGLAIFRQSKDPHALGALVLPALGLLLLVEAALFIQYYFYTVFYSRRELAIGNPVYGIGRFFYAFGKKLQVVLIFIGIGAVTGVLAALLKIFGKSADPSAVKFLMIAIRVLMQIITAYLAIKYYFVYVLAVNKIRGSLTISWNITKDNWWRLLGNSFALGILLALCVLIVSILGVAAAFAELKLLHMPIENLHAAMPLWVAVIVSFAMTLSLGVYAAFACVACRILYEEKHQADPSFVLESRA